RYLRELTAIAELVECARRRLARILPDPPDPRIPASVTDDWDGIDGGLTCAEIHIAQAREQVEISGPPRRVAKPTQTRRRAKHKAVAFHEAGHAVAAVVLGVDITGVTVRQGEDYAGIAFLCAEGADRIGTTPERREKLRHEARATLCGTWAERLTGARPTRFSWESDYWLAIEALACMDGRRVLKDFGAEWVAARRFVQGHKRAIAAVAHALMEQRHLTGEQVREIVAQERRSVRPR